MTELKPLIKRSKNSDLFSFLKVTMTGYPLANFEIAIKLDQTPQDIIFSLRLGCKDKGCLNANIEGSILSELFLNIFNSSKNINGYQVKAILRERHNAATHDGRGLSYLNSKLEGGIHALICILFSHVLGMEVMRMSDYIVIESSLEEVQEFYNKLGFEKISDNKLITKVSDLLQRCQSSPMSIELAEIVEAL